MQRRPYFGQQRPQLGPQPFLKAPKFAAASDEEDLRREERLGLEGGLGNRPVNQLPDSTLCATPVCRQMKLRGTQAAGDRDREALDCPVRHSNRGHANTLIHTQAKALTSIPLGFRV